MSFELTNSKHSRRSRTFSPLKNEQTELNDWLSVVSCQLSVQHRPYVADNRQLRTDNSPEGL